MNVGLCEELLVSRDPGTRLKLSHVTGWTCAGTGSVQAAPGGHVLQRLQILKASAPRIVGILRCEKTPWPPEFN